MTTKSINPTALAQRTFYDGPLDPTFIEGPWAEQTANRLICFFSQSQKYFYYYYYFYYCYYY